MSKKKSQAKSRIVKPMQPTRERDLALPNLARASSKTTLEDLLQETPLENRAVGWEEMRSVGQEF
jgi:hypothetical protein